MDYEAAIARVDGMILDVVRYNDATNAAKANNDVSRSHALLERIDKADDDIIRDLAVVTKIAKTSTHINWKDLEASHPQRYYDRWVRSLETLKGLRAELASIEEVDQIMGPTGPSMSATALHPAIWHAALDLWSDEHYREAVQAAATGLDLMTSAKTGLDLTGKPLFGEAFSSGPAQAGRPRLRYPECVGDGDAVTNQHEGTRNISVGAMQLIRNVTTHSLDPLVADVAFEYLAVLSVVARQVERATLVSQGDPDPLYP